MHRIKELREQRAKLVADARKLLDKAEGENRELSSEEQAQWAQMMTEVDSLKQRVDRLEEAAGLEEEVDETVDSEPVVDDSERSVAERLMKAERRTAPNQPNQNRVVVERRAGESNASYNNRVRRSQPAYHAAFNAYLLGGPQAIMGAHARSLQADSDILGGYLVPPQQFVDALIKFIDDNVLIRQFATKETLTEAHTLGVPTLDVDVADADWTVELATGNEDTSLALGKREFNPHPLAKRVKVSNKLLRLTSNGAENLVRDRLAYKFAVAEEKAFLTGDGAQKPLGLFTASASGVPTTRDVNYDNADDNTKAASVINAFYALKQQYRGRSVWIAARPWIADVRKLKATTGEFLWQPGLNGNQQDTLMGRPIYESEYVVGTLADGTYPAIFGDMSFYWIADAMTLAVQRLVELYAETNQVGFIGRLEVDGMPVLAEAFARLKVV